MSHYDHDALVSSVYAAAHEVDGWLDALDGLSEALGLDAYVLMRYAGGPAELICVGGSHVSERADQRYGDYYQAIDPRLRHVREARAESVFSCSQHFDDACVSRSEFYQDFLIPEGLRFCMATAVRMPDGTDYALGLQRSAERGPYGAEVLQRFQRLIPHLSRSLRIYDRLGRQQGLHGASEAALRTFSSAILYLGDDGVHLGGNDLAQSYLADASFMKLERRAVGFTDPRSQEDFSRALRRCLGRKQSGSVLVNATRAGAGRFTATLLPASHESPPTSLLPPAILQVAGIRAACILAPLGQRSPVSIAQLIHLFDLTPAEAGLARAVAAGVSLASYSSDHDVATSTLRSQLHVVFRKVGCDRQAELVRLLGSIPALPETHLRPVHGA